MRLIVAAACTRLFESSIKEPIHNITFVEGAVERNQVLILPLRVRTPGIVLNLLFYEFSKIYSFIETVCFGSWVANPPFVVKFFSNLDAIRINAVKSR